jgi:hypothetical protein
MGEKAERREEIRALVAARILAAHVEVERGVVGVHDYDVIVEDTVNLADALLRRLDETKEG